MKVIRMLAVRHHSFLEFARFDSRIIQQRIGVLGWLTVRLVLFLLMPIVLLWRLLRLLRMLLGPLLRRLLVLLLWLRKRCSRG
jgi:hypothetical protein